LPRRLLWQRKQVAILACHEAGINVTLPKPQTSGAKSEGCFGKQDFAYCQRRTSIAVQLGSDCRIAIQPKKTARCCAVLNHRLLNLFAQIAMHDRARAANYTMGAPGSA